MHLGELWHQTVGGGGKRTRYNGLWFGLLSKNSILFLKWHMKSLHYKVLCGSFDRVTDTIWFNNEMTAGSATSVSQSCTHTHPIPPPVPRYRQSIWLERSTLIHNKQQFFTSLCISGDNYHTTLSLASFTAPAQLSITCSVEKQERAWNVLSHEWQR